MDKQDRKNNFITVFRSYFNKKDIFLLPNILCYFRLLLIVVFLIFFFVPITIAGNDQANYIFATATIVLAAYTDFIDGYIARTFDMTSNLGKAMDPIADKFLQFAIVFALCFEYYQYPSLFLLISVIVAKEVTLFFEDVALARYSTSLGGAKWYGKVSTFLLYMVLGAILFFGPLIVNTGYTNSHYIIDSLCTLATFFLVLAWLMYFIKTISLINKAKKIEQEGDKE